MNVADIFASPLRTPGARAIAAIAAASLALGALGGCEPEAAPKGESGGAPSPQSSTIPPPEPGAAASRTLFATSTFPYGPSAQQVDATFRIAAELSQMYMVQLDDGVPWAEALDDKPWPSQVESKWADLIRRAPKGRPVYLALEPLDQDRTGLAPATAGSSVPRAIRGGAFDSDAVKRAYRNYVRRAVDRFKPTFLNLGVENGELAHRKPGAWDAYTRLITFVIDDIKRDHPDVRVGISFGLQSLMEPATARRCRPFIASCDYVGLSFYPYMSSFHEKFGAAPLPPPPDEWRKPLEWIRSYTDKPIAITETGYNTRDHRLPEWGISMRGGEDLQARYVRDLGAFAARDHYLFVVYYIPIDMGPLLDSLPSESRAFGDMWRENGLYDAQLRPKPALDVWKAIVRGEIPSAESAPAAQTSATAAQPRNGAVTSIGFSSEDDLFQAPADSGVRLDFGAGAPDGAAAMRWRFARKPGEFAWCARKLSTGALADAVAFRLFARSDIAGPIILQVKETDGEAFYTALAVSTTWAEHRLNLADMALDPKTRRNARLEPGAISEIVLADAGEGAPKGGERRSVWIARWIAQ